MSRFRYDVLVQKALIQVVKEILSDVSKNGLGGNHHFYVRFRTDHPGVTVPAFLKQQHPEEVMIVIQHQFWDLKVSSEKFSVELSFNGVREILVIPFASLTAFVDPSVKFALQFTPSFGDEPDDDGGSVSCEIESDGKIINFDNFRKK